MLKSYRKRSRDRFDGPVSIDSSLSLREDFYAATYMHWFKRQVIFDDGEDSQAENEPEEEQKPEEPKKKAEDESDGENKDLDAPPKDK